MPRTHRLSQLSIVTHPPQVLRKHSYANSRTTFLHETREREALTMGLTLYASLPSAAAFAAYLALCHVGAPLYLTLPVLHSALVGLCAAVAAHPRLNYTALFGKLPRGSFPWWSYPVFFPYLLALKSYVRLRRLRSGEPVFTEVEPGLFVGGWPTRQADVPPGLGGVVDCTCELPRNACLLEVPYLCVATWDTRGPRAEEIEGAVRWAVGVRAEMKQSPVLVHCAFGHGRSVTIMCAILVTLGVCDSWQAAETYIKVSRPGARLNKGQKKSLAEWTAMYAINRETELTPVT